MKAIAGIFILFFLVANNIIAQKIGTIDLTDTIITDPSLKKGVLKNGFTYYLKKDDHPGDKIYIRFLVKAGNAHEDEDQMELAHLLEHLALKSTRNFPEVKSYLQARKLVWGPDFNGGTGIYQTSYKIDIPSTDTQLLAACLLLVKDWADGGVNMSMDNIDAERGPVLMEIASRETPIGDAIKKYRSKVLGLPDNHLMARETAENVKTFKPEPLLRFYKDWYTPDNVALMITGNIDVHALERKIMDLYSNIEGTVANKYKAEPDSFINRDNQYIGLSVDGYDKTECKMYFKLPYQPVHTYLDAKSEMKRMLITAMIGLRFRNAEDENSVGSSIYVKYQPRISAFHPLVSGFVFSIENAGDAVQKVIQSMMYESLRVKKYGFDKWELDAAKKQMLDMIEDEARKPLSIGKYQTVFFEDIPVPDTKYQAAYSKQLLNSISIEEINRFVTNWSMDKNRDIVIITPGKKKQLLPSELLVNEWMKQVAGNKITPFVFRKPKAEKPEKPEYFPPLMSRGQLAKLDKIKPAGLQQKELKLIDATAIQLPNGITVILKPVTGKDEQVNIDAVNIANVYPKYSNDSACVSNATMIVGQSSVGVFDAKKWSRYKDKEGITFSTDIQGDYALLSYQSSAQKLETLLQAVHFLFVSPKVDTAFLAEWKAERIAYVDQRLKESSVQRLSQLNFIGYLPISNAVIASIKRMDGNSVLKMHRELFDNSGNLTFVISGNFDSSAVGALVSKYLGTIPLSKKMHPQRDAGTEIPAYKPVRMEANEGESQSSVVNVLFPGKPQNGVHHPIFTEILEYQFKDLVIKRLRLKEGLSYSPSGSMLSTGKYSGVSDFVHATFDCSRESVNDGIKYLQEELRKLQQDSVQAVMLAEAKEIVLHNFNKKPRDAKFWSNYLSETIGRKGDIEEIARYEEIIRNITPQEMAKFASSFSIDDYSLFIQHPKGVGE